MTVGLLLLFSYYIVCRIVREKDLKDKFSSKYLMLVAILFTLSICNVLLIPFNVNLIVDTSTFTNNQKFLTLAFKGNEGDTGNKQIFLI